jgi:YesN/AraC family two-component response regulator
MLVNQLKNKPKSKNILIVDDDNELRYELKELLGGYHVIEARNGDEALELLRRAYDVGLVILDVILPGGLNGIDLLKKIKHEYPTLNTIIMTGHSSKRVTISALKEHADDYIEKPLSIDQIKKSIEEVLGEPDDEPEISSLTIKERVERIKHFIQRNRFKKTTLKEASEAACCSPKYLSKMFAQYAAISFVAYKLKVKMDTAKEILKKTGYNVDQISHKLGYENAESFIRQFKKLNGMTPAVYRRQYWAAAKKLEKRGKK